jgi:hypothetical protein
MSRSEHCKFKTEQNNTAHKVIGEHALRYHSSTKTAAVEAHASYRQENQQE